MDNPDTITPTANAEAPVGAAPRSAHKSPKPTSVQPVTTASDQSKRFGGPVPKRSPVKPVAVKGIEGSKSKKSATKHAVAKRNIQDGGKSKKEQLVGLISKPGGARVSAIVERLGWQAHTIRAALSGLRKQGIAIAVSRSAQTGETVYAIAYAPDAAETGEASA